MINRRKAVAPKKELMTDEGWIGGLVAGLKPLWAYEF